MSDVAQEIHEEKTVEVTQCSTEEEEKTKDTKAIVHEEPIGRQDSLPSLDDFIYVMKSNNTADVKTMEEDNEPKTTNSNDDASEEQTNTAIAPSEQEEGEQDRSINNYADKYGNAYYGMESDEEEEEEVTLATDYDYTKDILKVDFSEVDPPDVQKRPSLLSKKEFSDNFVLDMILAIRACVCIPLYYSNRSISSC